MRKCVVCTERKTKGACCAECLRSLSRVAWCAPNAADALLVTEWAAKRARSYERKRAKKDARFCAACLERPA